METMQIARPLVADRAEATWPEEPFGMETARARLYRNSRREATWPGQPGRDGNFMM